MELELNNIGDSRGNEVSRFDGPDAAGSSGEDDVAALQREILGDGGDESRDVEDHVSSRSALPIRRVHFQPQFHVVRIRNRGLRGRRKRRGRRRFLED